jgi:hypothetical protein
MPFQRYMELDPRFIAKIVKVLRELDSPDVLSAHHHRLLPTSMRRSMQSVVKRR